MVYLGNWSRDGGVEIALQDAEPPRAESRELLLMIGKSINTACARMQGKAIGA